MKNFFKRLFARIGSLSGVVNRGVIKSKDSLTDWETGAESGIVYQDVCNDWTPFFPVPESQHPGVFDTWSCVSNYIDNALETQANQQGISLFPAQYQKNVVSKRYTAVGSGTIPNSGNTGSAVANFTVKNFEIPESELSFGGNDVFSYLDHNVVTAEMLAAGSQFLKDLGLQVQYEWISPITPENIAYHLKQAPLGFFIPICPDYNIPGIVPTCSLTAPQHCVMAYEVGSNHYGIFDSEFPALKQLALNYPIEAVIKVILTKAPTAPVRPLYTWTRELEVGISGSDVVSLQDVLIFEGFLNPSLNTGYFGINTKNALISLQNAHSSTILTPAGLSKGTGYCGQHTLLYLNNTYSKPI